MIGSVLRVLCPKLWETRSGSGEFSSSFPEKIIVAQLPHSSSILLKPAAEAVGTVGNSERRAESFPRAVKTVKKSLLIFSAFSPPGSFHGWGCWVVVLRLTSRRLDTAESLAGPGDVPSSFGGPYNDGWSVVSTGLA